MFYGSILFRFVGVLFIWIVKSIFRWKILSFKYIWNGEEASKSDDFFDYASSEIVQIFLGIFIVMFIAFWVTGIFNQIF
jgi:hypothetical protein